MSVSYNQRLMNAIPAHLCYNLSITAWKTRVNRFCAQLLPGSVQNDEKSLIWPGSPNERFLRIVALPGRFPVQESASRRNAWFRFARKPAYSRMSRCQYPEPFSTSKVCLSSMPCIAFRISEPEGNSPRTAAAS